LNPSTHLAPATISQSSSQLWLRNIGIAIAGSLLVAVAAHVALPLGFTPVPFTLQPFAVLLLGLVLAPRLAAGTMALYLAEGAAGLPVFAPGTAALSGFAHLFGPTGGYLLAYPVAVFAIATLWRSSSRKFGWAILSAAVGNVIILCIGALWLGILTHASMSAVLTQAVIPFLPGDALKVVVAAALGFQWSRLRPSRS